MWRVAVLFLALITPSMATDFEAGWVKQYEAMTQVQSGAPVTETWAEGHCEEAWDFYYALALARQNKMTRHEILARFEWAMDSIKAVDPVRAELREPIIEAWDFPRFFSAGLLKTILNRLEGRAKRDCKEEILSYQKDGAED